MTIPAGPRPVVVIGANGTGKSSLGVELVNRGAERISARRALEIPTEIQPQALRPAQEARQKIVNRAAPQRIAAASDFNAVLTQLNAEEIEIGRAVREALVTDAAHQPNRAKLASGLDHVKRIWGAVFPDRTLSFNGGEPIVVARHRGPEARYSQNEMSDGERQALYLVARIATIDDGKTIVVDEPETHMHPTLARRLWDLLEDFRALSRFVYITHDLLFAVSRGPCPVLACRANGDHQLFENIPDDLAAEILGAVSMPVSAARVIFCEGKPDSLDMGLLDCWFSGSDVVIQAVGSCDNVVKCVEAAPKLPGLRAVTSGVVDRDVRCSEELDHLRTKGVHVLEVAEIEDLYCLPGVLRAVMSHVGLNTPDAQEARLAALRDKLVRQHAKGLHRVALDRATDRLRWHFQFPLSKISPGANAAEAEANLALAYTTATTKLDPASLYGEAVAELTAALNAPGIEAMLRALPGKGVLASAAETVGMTVETLRVTVRAGLRGELTPEFKQALTDALAPHLPNR